MDSGTSEHATDSAWYDRILIFLPRSYRPKIFALVALSVLLFSGVKLNWSLEWDEALTSYFFLSICSAMTLLTAVWCLHARKFRLWQRDSLLDWLLFAISILLGLGAWEDHQYVYQGKYKFSRDWTQTKEKPDLLVPMQDDHQNYVVRSVWYQSIEPISSEISRKIEVRVLMEESQPCYIIHSRPEFAWQAPLHPTTNQTKGNRLNEMKEHKWELRNTRKDMQIVINVGVGKTADVPCNLWMEVREQ